jgi:enamine deaminase RidA (YjgF/YER057c/UK114 family)
MSTRTPIDPWPWSLTIGFHQAELIQRPERILVCAGQTAMSADGIPQHVGDMAAQVELSLDNLEAVLDAAGMTLTNVVRLNMYTTDVDAFFAAHPAMVQRLAAAGVQPPGTLLGVSRLAFPELLVELEATAIA